MDDVVAMNDRPEITYQDFGRLLTEHYQSLNPDTWFRDHGFEPEAERALIRAAVAIYPRLMMEGFLSGDEEAETLDNIVATMIIAGFALGWEFHKQLGDQPCVEHDWTYSNQFGMRCARCGVPKEDEGGET